MKRIFFLYFWYKKRKKKIVGFSSFIYVIKRKWFFGFINWIKLDCCCVDLICFVNVKKKDENVCE